MRPETQQLMILQKRRRSIITQMNRIRSKAVSYIASNYIGYNSFEDEKNRSKKWSVAEKIYNAIAKGKDVPEGYQKETDLVEDIVKAFAVFLDRLQDTRDYFEKQMETEVKKLPITKWWIKEKGRSYIGLAVIIGEAGDLTDYANPAKLWKRFGVAVIDGVRQGGLPSNAPKELWIKHGYNPRRRAALWTIGDSLMKTNGSSGRYKKVYDNRKEYMTKKLLAKHLEAGKSRKSYKPGHAHNDALRYMQKRLLRDVWNEANKN